MSIITRIFYGLISIDQSEVRRSSCIFVSETDLLGYSERATFKDKNHISPFTSLKEHDQISLEH